MDMKLRLKGNSIRVRLDRWDILGLIDRGRIDDAVRFGPGVAFPLPYIATTAGWWTAEMGRQPWVIYGLMRTAHAHSELVNPGDVVFTLLGFAGLYLLFVVQVLKEINRGPATSH
jgi:cytochrome bd-type quinol oxidase subunit 1